MSDMSTRQIGALNVDGYKPEDEAIKPSPSTDLLADRPFFARYKQRDPDPGVCRIVTIDWENKQLSMSNGCCRYYPSFDEVEIVDAQRGAHERRRRRRIMKRIVRSCFDKDADHHHTIESRMLHLSDMVRRPSFGGEWDSARDGERRLCEDEIAHAKFCLANKR